MKKLILMVAVAGFFVSCNSANSSNVECDNAKPTTEKSVDAKSSDCGQTPEAAESKSTDCGSSTTEKAASDCGSAKTEKATDCPTKDKKASDCGTTGDKTANVSTPC